MNGDLALNVLNAHSEAPHSPPSPTPGPSDPPPPITPTSTIPPMDLKEDTAESSSGVIDIRAKPEIRISQQDLPPSPPLTRSNSMESVPPATTLKIEGEGEAEGGKEASEQVWDPLSLQHDITAQLEEDEEFVATRGGPMYEAGDSVVDINGRVIYPESTGKRSRSNLQLESEHRTFEPQPWDLIDPPPTNGEKLPNPYGTLNSHKFSTLPESARSKSLVPKSSYYFGPPPPGSAYGTPPVGQIGLHHPREIIRVERDYTGGELIQFAPIYPLELEGRITPTQFLESINCINEILISAHSFRRAMLDNIVAVLSLQLSAFFWHTHYEKEMKRLQQLLDEINVEVYNPAGLNLLWPQRVAFLFLEIEYY